MVSFFRKTHFLFSLLILFFALDLAISAVFQPYILRSGRFACNDYEVTRRDHMEQVWDKVFFGNSMVISAYREDVSDSGYINLGLDYGVVRDLWEMVRGGTIELGGDLVIGLSYLTLYDNFETNPTYIWHKDPWVPYSYFMRDRLRLWLEDTLKTPFNGRPAAAFPDQTKSFYHGAMSQTALEEKEAASVYEHLPLSDFQENMDALAKLADYCAKHGVRLRCVWMPLNPAIAPSEEANAVRDRAAEVCQEKRVEFYNMEDALDAECFYDSGHLNYEYGSYRFTEVIDPWLAS